MAGVHSLSSSSLKLELRVVGAKNTVTKQKGSLFIRCYLSAGNNRRIQLNTQEITSSKKDDYLFWDDCFSLECNGSDDSISNLKEENIKFELRWQNTKPFIGKIGGSQLLASGEIPWISVFEAPNMEIQTWVAMSLSKFGSGLLKNEEGAKPPALQVALKIEVPVTSLTISVEEMRRSRRRERLKQSDVCGCHQYGGWCSCADNELLYVAEALEPF